MADVDTSVLEQLQAQVREDPNNLILAEALRCEGIKVIRSMQHALAEYTAKRYSVDDDDRREKGPTNGGGNGAQPRNEDQAPESAPTETDGDIEVHT
ncbi:MAG: hypothetical protein ACYS7M_12970 [Planctomycetota bacterium]